jgi:4-hydroxybenzoate polyprenyltransferase
VGTVDSGPQIRSTIRALRPHQWAKNLLLFVPLALTPDLIDDVARWARLGWAFFAWSAIASLGYLANDWLDRESDRADPAKRDRPFATGALSPGAGLIAGAGLAGLGFGAAWLFTPRAFILYLLGYLATTLIYSIWLKRRLLVDVLMLAGFYTARLLAGGAAAGIVLTPWLLAFSLFLFLGLALLKRFGDLHRMGQGDAAAEAVTRRAYRPADAPLVMIFGIASVYLSVLVLCLYINGAGSGGPYRRVEALWFLAPLLLYWVSRIWVLASRGEIGGDPVAFAVRDPVSLVTGALMGAVVVIAVGV